MSRFKPAVRAAIILIGAVLYLGAIAFLYSRPEVRVFGTSTAPLFSTASETGCRQKQSHLSEEAVRKQVRQQVQQHWQQVQKSHPKEEKR